MGSAPLAGMSLFEDSGAGSSIGARDAVGNTQIRLRPHQEWQKGPYLPFPA